MPKLADAPLAHQPPLLLLVGISAIGPIAMNGVLPANTTVMRELLTTYSVAQLVLTVYLFATMISQVVLGALADRIGRRPVMIGSLFVFGVGGIICAVSPTIEVLLAGRFVQGLGSSVCMFLTRAIMRDVHPKDKAASAIGYMNTAMMLGPMFAPAVCGWITDVSSWRIMYAALSVAGFLFSWLSYRYQNETLRDHGGNKPRMLGGSGTLLGIPQYRAYLILVSGTVGLYFSFLAGAPYVVMELRGTSASTFGLWFSMVALGYLLGNFIAGRWSQKLGTSRMISLSLIPIVVGVLLFWVLSPWDNLLALFLPMQFIALSNGMGLPNLTSALMSVRPELAGTASGLQGTVQLSAGMLLTIVVSTLLTDTALPLYMCLTVSALLALYGYHLLRKTDAV